MAKIFHVIQIQLNQLVFLNAHIITDVLTKRTFKHYHNDKHFKEFLPIRCQQKSAGIDMEQYYVTVTLCIDCV